MNEIVGVCSFHWDEIIFKDREVGKFPVSVKTKCIICNRLCSREYYRNLTQAEKQKIYDKRKIRLEKKINEDKLKYINDKKSNYELTHKDYVDNLGDWYVKRSLLKNDPSCKLDVQEKNVPDSMIEVHRIVMQIRRTTRKQIKDKL